MAKLRGQTAIVGIGQTPYYRRGEAPDPELKLCLRAIVAACEDAGVDPRDIDGFVSYGSEKSDGQRLMPALGTRELKFDSLVWTHGGGIPGALGLAAAAIYSGQAEIVAVYRSMAEKEGGRLRVAVTQDDTSAQYLVNGLDGPAQICAMRSQRMLEVDGVASSTMAALALASYHHAQQNPRALAYGRPLDLQGYHQSRWISEPYRLYDCSRESDAGVAVIMVSSERAKYMRTKPAYVLAAPLGAPEGWGIMDENQRPYTSSGFQGVARRLWADSGCRPEDVDVLQVYENMTGMGVGALIDHGFCTARNAEEVLRFENLITPYGKLPINTSGGNLAEGFIHGMGLVNEAVRQLRGESCNQVADAKLSLITGGPGDTVVSSALLATEELL